MSSRLPTNMKLSIFTPVVVVQWRQKKCTKNAMLVQNCCFANLNLFVLSINGGRSDSLFVDNESVCLSFPCHKRFKVTWINFFFISSLQILVSKWNWTYTCTNIQWSRGSWKIVSSRCRRKSFCGCFWKQLCIFLSYERSSCHYEIATDVSLFWNNNSYYFADIFIITDWATFQKGFCKIFLH